MHFWQGARIKDLHGEEYSAFGVSREAGGVHVSDAASDPGWNVLDRTTFTPIAEVDTTAVTVQRFLATGIRRSDGRPPGAFRWLVWVVYPVTAIGENTAYQEFQIKR